jgi:hypothetical protein
LELGSGSDRQVLQSDPIDDIDVVFPEEIDAARHKPMSD